ncbi:MAG: hypothetical protein RLY31_2592 [Bacteroidota bacterium]|jgi:preprotein translocase subunit YajC
MLQTFVMLQAGGNAGLIQMLFFGAIILVFWLFIIRPQAKRQKEQTRFADSMEKGQEVVTASGMLGRINKIEGEIVTLEVGPKSYIRITKGSVSKEMTEGLYGKEKKKEAEESAS